MINKINLLFSELLHNGTSPKVLEAVQGLMAANKGKNLHPVPSMKILS